MWVGVISFSPEFLERIGVYDPKTKEVDQRKIKEAVQKSMPTFLGREGLDVPETFWWGDIHLNTNHVHVHLTISQTKNTRPLKDNRQPKGTFSQKSVRSFKSSIHNKLELEEVRQREIGLEKELETIKKDLTSSVKEIVNKDQSRVNFLQQIYLSLPNYKDKRKWRASNHRKDFVLSRGLTKHFVDQLLEKDLHQSYQQFLKDINKQAERNKIKYGPNIPDTRDKKDKELKEYLLNRVFDYFREHGEELPRVNSVSKKVALSYPAVNELILELEKEMLQKLDKESVEAKRLRKEIGLRRYYIRQHNIDKQLNKLNDHLNELEKQEVIPQKVKKLAREKIEKEISLLKLGKLSKKQRIKQDLQAEYEKLKEECISIRDLDISKLTPKVVAQHERQLEKEFALVQKYKSIFDNGINPPYPLKTIVEYKRDLRILKLKEKIALNNQKYNQDLNKRNDVNSPLFEELKALLHGKNDRDIKNNEKATQSKAEAKDKEKKQVTNPGVLRQFNQLLNSLKYDGQKRMNALKKQERANDDVERLERKEEREEERYCTLSS